MCDNTAFQADRTLIRQCAPTLAGLKTASLFGWRERSGEWLAPRIREWDAALQPKGLRALPLRSTREHSLVYVYRPDRLRADLRNAEADALLGELGYPSGCPGLCLARLIRRLREDGEFPHEIGLFLGYPPEDVRGFIEQRASGYQCAGCWKVYGDACAAQQRFALYRRCTRAYCRLWERGLSLEALTVTCKAKERLCESCRKQQ